MQRSRPLPRIAIVGGGPGGLFTAHELQRLADRPVAMTVLEASGRLGGKVLTPRFESSGTRYEAGAAEFYDYDHFGHDPLKDLVRELGLTVRPMGGSAVVVDDAVVANLDDLRDRLGAEAAASLLAFDATARDRMTPREFYASGEPGDAATAAAHRPFDRSIAGIADDRARRFVERMIHSDLATEPDRTSEEYVMQNYLMNDPAYMRLYGIEGGNERLVGALASRIDAEIRLGCRAESVERAPGGPMIVRWTAGGVESAGKFDAVVIALPHDQLGSVAFLGDRLAPAVAAHRAHHDHPAHYLRITMLFDRPFWRATCGDSFWMLDRFGGCCLYDESLRDPAAERGVLGWLLGGEVARTLAESDDATIVAQALAALPPALARGATPLREARVHRWTGAVSALPGGRSPLPLDRRHCPEPDEHPDLYFVGDYLYDSTLNGVLDSAEYVAAWIAARIADAPTD
ncbi:MAG: FAD-dependent oxidoreductase [Phycisphaerales bacterium]|nr:FAD-dependent oxidoreductase [Phycisphaerales bacterium]